MSADKNLLHALEKRKHENAFRTLLTNDSLVDFCSNDYLGFARSNELKVKTQNFVSLPNNRLNGSTGSRLLRGNTAFAEELEQFITSYHKAEAGLLYNSGYDANIGLFSSVPQREDVVIYDELVHASIRDGIKLGKAKAYKFPHNDLEHLEKLLQTVSAQNVFIAVESVYSMDGDFAPLREIAALCEKYNAQTFMTEDGRRKTEEDFRSFKHHLIVDEAHATGLFGEKGEGRVVELGLEGNVFARVHTFGKALGCHGAIVLGSTLLRDYLINFSRSFIYTTALPIHSLVAVKSAYDILSNDINTILKTSTLTKLFKEKLKEVKALIIIDSDSPIQCVVLGGNEAVKSAATLIQKAGFDVRPILSPTVPKGKERLRICIHAFNTENEIEELVKTIEFIVGSHKYSG